MAVLTEIQTMIQDQAQSWARDENPVLSFRQMRDAGVEQGFTQTTWEAMVEMGWPGMIVPEAHGGSGLDYFSFGLVLEQLGQQLVASPLFSSAFVGASALILGGNVSQQEQYLPSIADGSSIFTLAVDETPHHRSPAHIALEATATADGFSLSGSKIFVPEGMAADVLVVAARSDGSVGDEQGITLLLVPTASAGVYRQSMHAMDSRGYATFQFDALEISRDAVLGEVGHGTGLLDQILDRARAGLAAEMLGTASRAFQMTLEYLKVRKQFGKVIGSFQALNHRAAELFTRMELARSCVEAALQAVDAEAGDIPELCSAAQVQVGEFLHDMSNQLIQIHGGIGMTDEFDAGFYLKRARVLDALYGNQAFHRDRYARLIGF